MKTCTKCGVKFEPFKKRGSRCRACIKAQDDAARVRRERKSGSYYEKNKERIKQRAREWYWKNRERARLEQATYRAETGYSSKYYAENKGYFRDYHLKRHRENPGRKYGLSAEVYWKMVEDSAGVCRICQLKMEKICVDHDHKTGKVRGLLCFKCNVAIGHMNDDPDRLEQAAIYLRESQA